MATHQAVYVHAATSGCHHMMSDDYGQATFFLHLGGIGSQTNAVAMPDLGKAHLHSHFSLQSS